VTHEEFKIIQKELDFNNYEMADFLCVSLHTVESWRMSKKRSYHREISKFAALGITAIFNAEMQRRTKNIANKKYCKKYEKYKHKKTESSRLTKTELLEKRRGYHVAYHASRKSGNDSKMIEWKNKWGGKNNRYRPIA